MKWWKRRNGMGINLIGIDMKARLFEAIKRGIRVYEEECGRQTVFGEPLVGYANTSEIIFDMFYDHDICKLPRKVYNPARAVIVYFLPYTEDVVESNRGGGAPSDKWVQAYHDSMWAMMKVNASITEEIGKFGRLASICNVPTDWDEKKCGPEWNYKMAAYACKMGDFGPSGCIMTEAGPAGRFGAILTDINLVPERDFGFSNTESRAHTPEMEAEYEKIMADSCYIDQSGEGKGSVCSAELIAACPAGAVSADGIDRVKCQAYCKTINEFVPTPDMCGKCYLAAADRQVKSKS